MSLGILRRLFPAQRIDRALARSLVFTLAGSLLLCAVALTSVRLLLPEIAHYRPQVEVWVSGLLGQSVRIGSLEANWRGWVPELRINDVELLGELRPDGTRHSLMQFENATFSLDPRASLRAGELRPREMTISGASLAVTRKADGSFSLRGLDEIGELRGADNDALARWLLDQSRLELADSRILWSDETRGGHPIPLTNVSLRLDQFDDRHQVRGIVTLPGAGSGKLSFGIDMEGDLLTPSWSGDAFVRAADLDLGLASRYVPAVDVRRLAGRATVSIWSTWRFARLLQATGDLEVRGLRLSEVDTNLALDEVSGSFQVVPNEGGWEVDVDDFVVASRNGIWPRSKLNVSLKSARDNAPARVVLKARYLRLEDVVDAFLEPTVASPGPEPASPLRVLADLGATGVLENVHLSLPFGRGKSAQRPAARADITQVSMRTLPGPTRLHGLRGRFEAGPAGALIEIDDGRAELPAEGLDGTPLHATGLRATVTVLATPNGVRLRFDDVSARTPIADVSGAGWLLAPHDARETEISAFVDIGPMEFDRLLEHLPASYLPPEVAKWFDSAVENGRIEQARVLLHGRPSDFPFDGASGRVEARARVSVPRFRYASGWPDLTDARGTMRFDGRMLEASLDSARLLRSTVGGTRVRIDDMTVEHPRLSIAGTVRGTSEDTTKFLARTPLRDRFKHVIETVAFRGRSEIELDIDIPLGRARSVPRVHGAIHLLDNTVDLPGLDRGLESVNGKIVFEGNEIHAEDVTAQYLGRPIGLEAGRSPRFVDGSRLTITGRSTRQHLADHLHNAGIVDAADPKASALLARLTGDASWQATLDIPHARSEAQSLALLRVGTDLEGAGLNLPSPFGKPSETRRALWVESDFKADATRNMSIRYGDLARAAFDLRRAGARYALERGRIVLGPGEASLGTATGVTIEGDFDRLDVGEWHALLQGVQLDARAGAAGAGEASPLEHVRSVHIRTRAVTALGSRFRDAELEATRTESGDWRLTVDGPQVQGVLSVPKTLRGRTIEGEFEQIVFDRDADAGTTRLTVDPAQFPAMSFAIKRLVLNRRDLGLVKLETAPAEDGLEVRNLYILSPDLESRAQGTWTTIDGAHRTALSARAYSANLGAMLTSLGFAGEGTVDGATEISLDANWPGSPADFTLKSLTGVLHFRSSEGHLEQVSRGATGRVFGLLSFTSLPRRLTLDFSDLFESGMSYQQLEGSFAIESGNAYTNNLVLDSETARIEVAGRAGLVNEDYDQIVTVTPKLTSSLPLAPIWLAEKMFQKQFFDRVFSFKYTITGSWDDPVVEPVDIEVEADPAPADRG